MSDLISRLAALSDEEWKWVVRELAAYYRDPTLSRQLPSRKAWDALRRRANRKRAVYQRGMQALAPTTPSDKRRAYMRVYMAQRRGAST